VPAEADGFRHPSSEAELIALVKAAAAEGRQLRVRGAAHSPSHAIYTDPVGDALNQVDQQAPPPGPNYNVMLDRYRGWEVRDEGRRLVEAQAGINLGADPSDPTATATLKTSLLSQLFTDKDWTLSSLGGISHQTVSGFTATGSAGGSVTHSIHDNLWGFRVIDGAGEVHEFTRDDPDPSLFYAMAPNMGLLGVVSTVTVECVDTFNIVGDEAITTIDGCAVDLFGPGSAERPSLQQFLRDTEYCRVEWWPQRGAERVLVWQATRVAPEPGFTPHPYEEFTNQPDLAEVFISLLYTIVGNVSDLSHARPQLERTFARVENLLELEPWVRKLGRIGDGLVRFLDHAAEFGLEAAITVLEPFAQALAREIPTIFPKLLGAFITLDSEKDGDQKGQPQRFQDYGWAGLPMDNAADDQLVPTEFSELWVPLRRTQEVMTILHTYFTEPEDDHEAYRRTGLYAWELYAAKPTPNWMAASHTSGEDEWSDGALRIDPYWFTANPGDPAEVFYPDVWNLVRDHQIPFRLHWGKFQPVIHQPDRGWVDFFKAQYPRWDDFLALRAQRDPQGTFLTRYWRDRFGLWQA
jgi:D-arabinono-1,4-lactone oxidase